MVAFPRLQGLTGSLPLFGAALAGIGAVGTVTMTPAAALEQLVWTSGIAAIVPAAEPPLGITARAVLALAGGGAAAAVAWAALFLLFGPGGFLDAKPAAAGVPAVRRGDAHPDAPPRRPMSAADLGTPLMEVAGPPPEPQVEAVSKPQVETAPEVSVIAEVLPVERTVPADLDERLSAFDPEAIPPAPAVAFAVAPTPRPTIRPAVALAPGERLETFELTPVVRFGTERPPEPSGPPSLDALIRRLEQGASRRAAQG